MKNLKIPIIMIIIILAIMAFIVIYNQLPKHDEEEIELFQMHKEDFILINEYILETFPNIDSIYVCVEGREITSIFIDEEIYLPPEIKAAFNSIHEAFLNYEFSFVEITEDRISYGGLGYRMYVFSRNGKVPNYFYFPGDNMHEEVYALGDDWYLLMVNFL